MIKEKVGFSSESETKFLRRLPGKVREENLGQELTTQLAEDFGLVEFTLKYKFKDGFLTDMRSGQRTVELTSRGGVEEETESIKRIEEGLKNEPKKTWIHFSPENRQLNYPANCIDIWRNEDGEVIWNRIVVKNNFEEMNRVRKMIGKGECKNELEMLGLPVSVEMKLSEIFDLFRLSTSKYDKDFSYIKKIVGAHLREFSKEFGDDLTEDSDLILRLYSACHKFLNTKYEGEPISRRELNIFMYGRMREMKTEQSSGCSATTTVGAYGESIGYYVGADGKVSYGAIPEGEGYKECTKCHCWYKGDKCPFC